MSLIKPGEIAVYTDSRNQSAHDFQHHQGDTNIRHPDPLTTYHDSSYYACKVYWCRDDAPSRR